MDGNLVGFAAVVMALGIPMAAMYTFYHVRKLRTDERLAASRIFLRVPGRGAGERCWWRVRSVISRPSA
jgi:hypothetical protein